MPEIEEIKKAFDNKSFPNLLEDLRQIIISISREKLLGYNTVNSYKNVLNKISIVESFSLKKNLPLPSELKYRRAIIYLLSDENRDIKRAERIFLEIIENEKDELEWKDRSAYYLSMYIYLKEYCVESYNNEESKEDEPDKIYKITRENIIKAEKIYNDFYHRENLSDFIKSFMLEFKNRLEQVNIYKTDFKVLTKIQNYNKREIFITNRDSIINYKNEFDLYIDYLSDNKDFFIRGELIKNKRVNKRLLILILKEEKILNLLDLLDISIEKINNLEGKISTLRDFLRKTLLSKEFNFLKKIAGNDKNIEILNKERFFKYKHKFMLIDNIISTFEFDNFEINKKRFIQVLKNLIDQNVFSLLIENISNSINSDVLNLLDITIVNNESVNNFDFNKLNNLDKSSFELLFDKIKELIKQINKSTNVDLHPIFSIIDSKKIKNFSLFLELTFEDFINHTKLNHFLENDMLDHLFPIKDDLNNEDFKKQFDISKKDFLNILNNIVNVIEYPIKHDKENNKYKINDYISTALSFEQNEINFEK